jgi:nucleotide-binding universal stress UspA family protein
MIRTILVPLDGSTFAEQALPLALLVARRAGARVELLFVHTPLQEYSELVVFDAPLDVKIRNQEKLYLEKTLQDLSKKSNVRLSTAYKDGNVPDVIQEHARAIEADLIVMTTHARGPMGRFWLGSVADSVIRRSTFPLLLVHPQEHKDAAEAKVSNILVPLDGTRLAERILDQATTLAKAMDAAITLVRVIKPLLPMTAPLGVGSFGEMAFHMTQEIEKLQKGIWDEAAGYLEKIAERLRTQGFKVSTCVQEEDQAARGILSVKDVDLIAMETHGRGGLARFFLGSVADKVLRGAQVPLLLCRPKK